MAIQSFRNAEIENFYLTGKIPSRRGWQSLASVALRKLDMLKDLKDLRVPPNNQLKLLKGDMASLYSIRINDQWRVVFVWTQKGPLNVDIVDYH